MRTLGRLVHGLLLTAVLAGCSGSMTTAPGGGGRPPGVGGTGGGTGGDVGGGAGGPASGSVTVSLGNNFFRSDRNGTANPAVDTVLVGGTVTWTWVSTGMVPHNVESVGAPSFTSGPLETGDGSTYHVTFTAAGSYRYNCAIHGDLMRGTIVVVAQ